MQTRAQTGASRATRRGPARAVRRRSPPCPWVPLDKQGRGLRLDHFVTFHIIRLANAAKTNVTRRYLLDYRLKVPEWRLLGTIINLEPVRFSAIVTRTSMDKGQVSRTVQTLTRRGLISARTPSGNGRSAEGGGQGVILSLTPKGRRLYRTVLPVAQRNQARLLGVLTEAERKSLYSILTKLFATIGDENRDL